MMGPLVCCHGNYNHLITRAHIVTDTKRAAQITSAAVRRGNDPDLECQSRDELDVILQIGHLFIQTLTFSQ